MGNHAITAVIVLYNPDPVRVVTNVRALLQLGLPTVIVDNTPDRSRADRTRDEMARELRPSVAAGGLLRWLEWRGNVGLSSAYNRAVRDIGTAADGVLFLDQDSSVQPQALQRLQLSFDAGMRTGRLGVLGGTPLRRSGEPYRACTVASGPETPDGLVACWMVPSSFSIVPTRVFQAVGGFQEDFFIDHIDVDFCARCRKHGLLVLTDPAARFPHEIGERDVRLFGRYLCPGSTPMRHYFQFRNAILSARRGGVSGPFAALECAKRMIVVVLSAVALGQPAVRLRWALRGIADGVRNRGGPLSL